MGERGFRLFRGEYYFILIDRGDTHILLYGLLKDIKRIRPLEMAFLPSMPPETIFGFIERLTNVNKKELRYYIEEMFEKYSGEEWKHKVDYEILFSVLKENEKKERLAEESLSKRLLYPLPKKAWRYHAVS